ncbi:MAG: hypothetical protein ACYC1C_10510 [Chloroflexota bacterium]
MGSDSIVYVVRDAWGDGCSVLAVSDVDSGARPGHFLRPHDAVAAAVQLADASRVGKVSLKSEMRLAG